MFLLALTTTQSLPTPWLTFLLTKFYDLLPITFLFDLNLFNCWLCTTAVSHGDPVLLLSYCKEHWDGTYKKQCTRTVRVNIRIVRVNIRTVRVNIWYFIFVCVNRRNHKDSFHPFCLLPSFPIFSPTCLPLLPILHSCFFTIFIMFLSFLQI